jgi:outer membrane protein assembly factor BamB
MEKKNCVSLVLLLTTITLLNLFSDSLSADDTKQWIRETGSMDNNAVVDELEAPFTEDIEELSKFTLTPGKDGRNASSSVVINGSKAYYTSYDISAHKEYVNKVYCRDINTNVIVWEFVTDKPRNRNIDEKNPSEFYLQGIDRAPLLYENKLFFGTLSGTFYCLNADKGELIWSTSLKYKLDTKTSVLGFISCTPVAYKDSVFVGISYPMKTRKSNCAKQDSIISCYDIYQFNIFTGKIIKKYISQLENYSIVVSMSSTKSNLSLDNGKLFAGIFGNIVCFNDDKIDTPLWKFYLGGNFPYKSSPTVLEDRVYYGTAESDLFCLSITNGKVIWRTQYKDGIRCTTSITVKDEKIYLGTRDNSIYCLSKLDGSIIWKYKTPESILSTPVLSGNRLFVGIYGHELLCINANNGKLIKSYDVKGSVNSTVAISDGKIYFGTDDGVFYCFGEKPTRITIQANQEMKVGETQICIFKSFSNEKKEYKVHLKFSVEPEDYATIDSDGKISANNPGKCKIIARCNGTIGSLDINIKE